jgi:ABC-2 type transport system ATP-binding protein
MIIAENLSKHYGDKHAVSDISFTVAPGRVTGFLGPNGAGKSTTMRMIVGLDKPTSGKVTVNGRSYAASLSPLTEIGVLLDAKAVHTGRSARNHLRVLAATHGIPRARVDEVVRITGLGSAAHRRAGGFSLGMGQRLGIAAALIGDPQTLILDEPVNGLDPEGVIWVREFVRDFAARGKTVLLSSHLMSEMAMTADHLIVLGRGRVLADAPVADVVRDWTTTVVQVRTPRLVDLADELTAEGAAVTGITSVAEKSLDPVSVTGIPMQRIAEIAASHHIPLYELASASGSLEDAYLALTSGEVEYKTEELS